MTGVGTYASLLAEALAATPGLDLRTYSPDPAHAQLGPLGRARLAPGRASPSRLLWLHGVLPWRLATEGVDLLHATNFIAPLLAPCPTVLTIHDLGIFRHPEFFDRAKRLYTRAMLPLAARQAAVILTVSEASRADAIDLLHIPPEKVGAVPEAASPLFKPASTEAMQRVRDRYSLRGPFIMAVGSLQPRKNLYRLLEAHQRLRERGLTVDLILVGPDQAASPALRDRIRARGSRVRWLGYVPAGDLPALYTAASVSAYVSLFEGFGLPALEALACGCPLVCAAGGALDEVVGQAALQVDPTDTEAIARTLERILVEPGLSSALRTRGVRQAAHFSWEQAARQTSRAYRKALKLDREAATLPDRPARCSSLGWAILRTLAYADVFDSPLRSQEVWRALQGVSATLGEVEHALAGDELAGRVEKQGDVHFLAGRAAVVATRAQREAAAERYFAWQGPAMELMARIPFVRMLALSGGAAHRTSLHRDDLDLFVVAKRGRAYTALVAAIVVTKLRGMRQDVCSNYVVDEDHLSIDVQHDVYTAHQLIHLWPALGEVTYRRFWQANSWVHEYFPNAAPRSLAPEGASLRSGRRQRVAERALGLAGLALELTSRAALTAYLHGRHGRAKAANLWLGPGTIKLHVRDHRGTTLQRFAERLEKLAQAFAPAAAASADDRRT